MNIEEATEMLADIVARVEQDVIAQRDRMGWTCDPAVMRDSTGRYILLDAYTALVTAKAAIHRGR